MEGYGIIEDRILDEIFSVCEECPNRMSCVEMECPLYRIENIITGEHEEER